MKYPQGLRLLIDGDILKYRCAFAAEKTHYLVSEDWTPEGMEVHGVWDNHKQAKAVMEADTSPYPERKSSFLLWSRKEVQPEEFALECVNTTLESFVAKFTPSSVDVFLSAKQTFRESIAKTKPYKGNRDGAIKPVHFDAVGDYLLGRGGIVLGGLEADDAIAIEMSKDPKGTVCISIDKDMLQVPGIHYNWVKDELIEQTKRDADFALATQLLTGDTVDNVPGLGGFGPKKAKETLDGARGSKDLFNRVLKAYRNNCKENWQEYFVEQYKLIRLLRTHEEKDSFPDLEIQEETTSGFKV